MIRWEDFMILRRNSITRASRQGTAGGTFAYGRAVLVAALLSAALASSGAAQSVLRVGLDIPVRLDPAFASSDSEIAVLNSIYDYLVDVDERNEVVPRLAREWRVSEDGLTFVFEITENAVFHDGSPLTAEDVVWTFDRLRDPEQDLPTADLYAGIDSIEATGRHQVTFRLEEPNPFFLYDLSDNHALIVKAGAEDLGRSFNGSGPFMVESYAPEDRMILRANSEYHLADRPGVDRLELIFFSDQAAAVNALRGGQIDLVLRMPTAVYRSLANARGVERLSVATNAFDLVRLRSDRPPGNDPRVVQALKLAVDREMITEVVTQGLGHPGKDSPIGPLYENYYLEDLDMPDRDVERARELLAEAGYPDGLSLELRTPDTGDRPDLAVVLQQQLGEAGFDIDVVVEPESVYYGENHWLEVDFGITGWGSRPVPQFYLDVMLRCDAEWNESHFCDPEFEKLARLAGSTLDEGERRRAYAEIQQLLADRGPIVIPYFFPQLGAIREGFQGFQLKAFPGRSDLSAVRVE
jgi:peptide/nickel transport system substrate-binding protein